MDDAYAQRQQVVDSLHAVLVKQSGVERFHSLYELTFEFIHRDNDRALEYIKEAGRAALISGDSSLLIKSIRVRGQILHLMGRPQEAILILAPLTKTQNLNKYSKDYFEVMMTIGASYLFMSQFDKALAVFFQAYVTAKTTDERVFISAVLTNIGLVYYKLKNYEKALQYWKEALSMTDSKVLIELNITLCYVHLQHLEEAREYLNRVVMGCADDCLDVYGKHVSYAEGHILFKSGRFLEAEAGFNESLRLATEDLDIRMQLDNLYELAKISIQGNQLLKAEKLLGRAEQIIEGGTPFNMEKLKVYEQLSGLCLSMKKFKRAAFYQSAYIKLRDSIYNETVMSSLMDVESKHIQREHAAQIAEQNRVILSKQEMIKRQKQMNILFCIVAGLTIIIIVFLIRSYNKKRRLSTLLERRVRDRTRELEMNRYDLLRKTMQQDLLLRRAFSGTCERLATLKGLCFTAQEEISEPVAREYVDKIDRASLNIDHYVRTSFRIYKESRM